MLVVVVLGDCWLVKINSLYNAPERSHLHVCVFCACSELNLPGYQLAWVPTHYTLMLSPTSGQYSRDKLLTATLKAGCCEVESMSCQCATISKFRYGFG